MRDSLTVKETDATSRIFLIHLHKCNYTKGLKPFFQANLHQFTSTRCHLPLLERVYLLANMASRLLIIFHPRQSASNILLSYWFPSGPTGLNEMRCTDVQLFASPFQSKTYRLKKNRSGNPDNHMMNSVQCQTIFLLQLGSELQIRSSWYDRHIISGTGSATKRPFVTWTKISGYPIGMLKLSSKRQCATRSAWRDEKHKCATQVPFLASLARAQVGPTEKRRSGRYLIPFNAVVKSQVQIPNSWHLQLEA